MSFENFFKDHFLFHSEELVAYLRSQDNFNSHTLKAGLKYHISKNHLARIRRGYYLVKSDYLPGVYVENDALLIAGRMTSDSVISYHSAMEFHGLAYSMHSLVYFNSDEKIGELNCPYGHYQQIVHPLALKPDHLFLETKVHDRSGMDIRVTTIERTLVDCLHRPNFCGRWEEIWRSFESVSFLDIDRVIQYALQLGNVTTIAKLGFFLEQHQEQFSVKEELLNELARSRPKSRHYMEKNYQGPVKNLTRWNLIVPLAVIEKTWEEPNHDTF